jgi:hypothetical protein
MTRELISVFVDKRNFDESISKLCSRDEGELMFVEAPAATSGCFSENTLILSAS